MATSDQLEESEAVCSRIFVFANGRIAFQWTQTDLRIKFGCGYLIRPVSDTQNPADLTGLLEKVKETEPQTSISQRVQNAVAIPVSFGVAELLRKLINEKELKSSPSTRTTSRMSSLTSFREQIYSKMRTSQSQRMNS